MKITLDITDSEFYERVSREINLKVDLLFKEKIKNINIDEVIQKRVDFLIDRSKYVSDSIIRNLVQQRVAKELTNKIINDI